MMLIGKIIWNATTAAIILNPFIKGIVKRLEHNRGIIFRIALDMFGNIFRCFLQSVDPVQPNNNYTNYK
jgi:hypothetical protein